MLLLGHAHRHDAIRRSVALGSSQRARDILDHWEEARAKFVKVFPHEYRRALAEAGHYPAIDVLESVSRLNRDLLTPEQLELTARARDLMATYRRNQDLINVGAYPAGSNPAIDQAIALHEPLRNFLRQAVSEGFSLDASWSLLQQTLTRPATLAPGPGSAPPSPTSAALPGSRVWPALFRPDLDTGPGS